MKDVTETTGKAAEARKLGIRIVTPAEIKTVLYNNGISDGRKVGASKQGKGV
jgi:hypothetical protein